MNTFVRHQKIIKVGNSAAFTVDPGFLANAKKSVGDQIEIRYADDGSFITVVTTDSLMPIQEEAVKKAQKTAVMESKITPEFRVWVEENLKKNEEAFKKLANL